MAPSNFIRLSVLVAFLSLMQLGFAIHEHNFINPFVGVLTKEQADILLSYHNILKSDVEPAIQESENSSFCGSKSCGTPNSPKIIGGTEAGINEFPWMVFILSQRTNHTYLCGGSLLSNRHVITAAHCVYNADKNRLSIFLGGHHLTNPGTTNTVRVDASEFNVHPEYNKIPMANDIAIITLNRSVQFTSNIQPICLPTSIRSYEGLTGTVTGWGRLAFNGTVSTVLMKVEVPIMTNEACTQAYPTANLIQPTMICAGGNGKDVCMGDSGGPLMILDQGRYECIGLVSFGHGASCGTKGIPGVYTRVGHFLPFINNIIDENKNV